MLDLLDVALLRSLDDFVADEMSAQATFEEPAQDALDAKHLD